MTLGLLYRAAAVAASLAAAPAAAQSMTVATFLAKAEALEAKGVAALFSSDLKLLKREVTLAGEANRAERARIVASGGKPASCPPKGAKMDQKQFLAGMRAIPPAERGMSLRAGMARLSARTWPCR